MPCCPVQLCAAHSSIWLLVIPKEIFASEWKWCWRRVCQSCSRCAPVQAAGESHCKTPIAVYLKPYKNHVCWRIAVQDRLVWCSWGFFVSSQSGKSYNNWSLEKSHKIVLSFKDKISGCQLMMQELYTWHWAECNILPLARFQRH